MPTHPDTAETLLDPAPAQRHGVGTARNRSAFTTGSASRPLLRQRLSLLLSMGLLLTLVITTVTGFEAGLTHTAPYDPHRYSSYLFIALAVAHLALSWNSLVARLRRWLDESLHGPEPEAAAPRLVRMLPRGGLAAGTTMATITTAEGSGEGEERVAAA